MHTTCSWKKNSPGTLTVKKNHYIGSSESQFYSLVNYFGKLKMLFNYMSMFRNDVRETVEVSTILSTNVVCLFDIRILITPLVSSSSSYLIFHPYHIKVDLCLWSQNEKKKPDQYPYDSILCWLNVF